MHVNLTLDVNVPVNEVNSVAVGIKAEVRFSAFHSRETPVMFGYIKTLSQDRLVDDATKEAYYLARIEIAESDIPDQIKSRIRAGMPAEVLVSRGERVIRPESKGLHK